MDKREFEPFVRMNMGQRWPSWQITEAVLSDWWLVLKDYTVEEAEMAVHMHKVSDKAIVSEPKAHEIAKMLRQCARGETAGELPPVLTPWILCLEAPPEHPDWEDEEWVRLDAGWHNARCTDREYVGRFANKVAKQVQGKEGGKWCGVVRTENDCPPNQPGEKLRGPAASEWAKKHILNGPDGPGKRFLQRKDKTIIKTVR